MNSNAYGRRLNPFRRLREPLAAKGVRQSVVVTNNPSTIDANQQLLVRFPNLGEHDVIVPGTVRLAFTIALNSTDANATVVGNLGRAIVKKTTIKVSGNEVMSIDDSDVFHCYGDLWLTRNERQNAAYQGIGSDNMLKHRVGADDANDNAGDNAIARAMGNRFCIPLDFEILESHMPFYQSALSDRLEYELTFNDYGRVVKASGDAAAAYTIDNISLEFDKITEQELARQIRGQFIQNVTIFYDRVLRHRKLAKNKSDTLWNINLNVPARSMKGILMLFETSSAGALWKRRSESFYNPKITKVEVTVEGVPNQLYSQGMRAYQQWEEARKFFASSPIRKRDPEVARVVKDLGLADVSLEEFLRSKYAFWLDLRTSDDDQLHGSGRRVVNTSEGITLQITKEAEEDGVLNVYLYVIMDAQLHLENGRFVSALY